MKALRKATRHGTERIRAGPRARSLPAIADRHPHDGLRPADDFTYGVVIICNAHTEQQYPRSNRAVWKAFDRDFLLAKHAPHTEQGQRRSGAPLARVITLGRLLCEEKSAVTGSLT